jgi:hypothetical protein
MCIGPVLGEASLLLFNFHIGSAKFNDDTSIGYIQALLAILMIILTLALFTEVPRDYRKHMPKHSRMHGSVMTEYPDMSHSAVSNFLRSPNVSHYQSKKSLTNVLNLTDYECNLSTSPSIPL